MGTTLRTIGALIFLVCLSLSLVHGSVKNHDIVQQAVREHWSSSLAELEAEVPSISEYFPGDVLQVVPIPSLEMPAANSAFYSKKNADFSMKWYGSHQVLRVVTRARIPVSLPSIV